MKRRLLFQLLFLICFTIPAVRAQDPPGDGKPGPSLNSGTIASQFDYITTKSNSFQEYKVVRKTWLQKIESNVADSLNSLKSELAETRTAIAGLKKEITDLQGGLETANTRMEEAVRTKNSISFLGAQTDKVYYNSIMWGIVCLLGALLLFFIFKFKKSGLVAAEAVRTLEETKEEFDQHRKRALEREQKLNRRLQDELNKQMG